jgi:exodeoxyribonuclease VII large subunit
MELFEPKVYTVSELTKEIKEVLESSFEPLWVEGEISNYTLHTSGHRYFSLKDENAQIRCTMWKRLGDYLRFEPENGMKILAFGEISVYEKNGQYQLNIKKLLPKGIGELELAFRQLYDRLQKEGVFVEENKKPIPPYPEKIGVVTSPTGAAIRDIIQIIQRRAPYIKIILNPVRVQGEKAAGEIAQAIKAFNEYEKVDVIIVGRGGGSLEDLWAFNEEVVARAIFNSKIPIISAVGHEIDFTIADFAADLRAPTPSAAAELVVKDKAGISSTIKSNVKKMGLFLSSLAKNHKQRLEHIKQSSVFRRPLEMITAKTQLLDDLTKTMLQEEKKHFELKKNLLSLLIGKLEVLSPLAVLSRGYSITRKMPEMILIKEAGQFVLGDEIEVRLAKGRIESKIKKIEKEIQKQKL